MTPSLARMVMARRAALPLPLKWFSIPQCWRYERMTRGRRREHYQWNMDVWGVSGAQAEAELLGAITNFFERVGLTAGDIGIKINSRQVLAEIMTQLGVPDDKFGPTCVLVDKLEKVPLDAIRGDFRDLGLDDVVIDRLTSILAIETMDELQVVLGEDSDALVHLQQIFAYAEAYGFRDWLVFDASVVRGLSYYTGAVFEAFDRAGEFRAICGGGRYDKLLTTFGGEPLEACGFGVGDAVIVEMLKSKDLLPVFEGVRNAGCGQRIPAPSALECCARGAQPAEGWVPQSNLVLQKKKAPVGSFQHPLQANGSDFVGGGGAPGKKGPKGKKRRENKKFSKTRRKQRF
eukprot:FR744346.1.p1 GENE.FR744346.1~~FR744346.1.p1  ORF type:complete len:375 (+),score=88.21 FR744346.1:90-1127(+)